MICFIALAVFAFLGIFSAKYRTYAKEAFDCVFRRLTLRKCESGLDQRLKSKITGKLMTKHPRFAKGVYRHFESISWAFTIILIVSLAFTIQGIYNYAVFGNCNGPDSTAFCIFDPLGTGSQAEQSCSVPGTQGEINGTLPIDEWDPSIGPEDAKVTIIEAGCFRCPYTRQAEPVVKQVLKEYEGRIRFVYKDFPLESLHNGSYYLAIASHCAHEQGKFWEYHDLLFANQFSTERKDLLSFANSLALDMDQFTQCLDTEKYKYVVDRSFEEGLSIGIYGTPTFFINDQILVGPKSFYEFKSIIDQELAK